MPSWFSRQLRSWHETTPRELPWTHGPRDAYHIWISEVIMQQTRINQGAQHYLRFISRFPTVQILANASEDDVMQQWQGLGYYTRARNIHKAAKQIIAQHNGRFPESYNDILQLPGVGPYSAAAIASFAFGLRYPVVDGNVKRVIARFAGLMESVDLPATHKEIYRLAQTWMRDEDPALFNQAIMNLGAMICTPGKPQCSLCPLQLKCVAHLQELTTILPVRSARRPTTDRFFHFLVLEHKGKILLIKRNEKDIWQGLYAPPLMESKNERSLKKEKMITHLQSIVGLKNISWVSSGKAQSQTLTHRVVVGRFHYFTLNSAVSPKIASGVWVTSVTQQKYGKPKMIADLWK